jgi:hypothetical protein
MKFHRPSALLIGSLPLLVLACDAKSRDYATSFSTKPLVPTSDTLGGHAYTLQLPSGLAKGDVELGAQHYTPPKSEDTITMYAPDVSVSHVPGQPKVSSLSSAYGSPTITRKDENATSARVTLVATDRAYFIVRVAKALGNNGYLECDFEQKPPKGQVDFDALVAFGEKVCETLSPNVPTTTGATLPAAEAAQPAAAVTATPEMQQFLGAFGSSTSITRALQKHGKKGLATHDMGLYDMTEPKIVSSTTVGARTCYTVDAAAGMTTRTYAVCWEKGKIVEVDDKGMR